jgi:predicted metal-dependent hydrolase
MCTPVDAPISHWRAKMCTGMNHRMTDSAVRPLLIAAAREFNAGRYFEAHEVLEDGLESVPDDLWELFVGLIQIAVGYHKLTQGLWNGAARMLERGLEKIAGFPADAADLHMAPLRERVRRDLDALHIRQFDGDAFARRPPRLRLVA